MYKRSKAEVERIVNSLKGPVPPPPESMLDRMRNEYYAQMSPQYEREVKLEREQERQRMEQEERDFNANWDRQRREHLVGPSPRPPRIERDQTGRRWSAVSPQKQTRHYRFAEPIPFPSLEGGSRSRGDTQRKHMKHVARCLELRGGSLADDFSGFIRGLQDPNSESSKYANLLPGVSKPLMIAQIGAPLIRQAFMTTRPEDSPQKQLDDWNASEQGKYYNAIDADNKAREAETERVRQAWIERDKEYLIPGFVPPPVVEQRPSPGIIITPRSTDKYVSCDTSQGHMKRNGTCVDRRGIEVEGNTYGGGACVNKYGQYWQDVMVGPPYTPSNRLACKNLQTLEYRFLGGKNTTDCRRFGPDFVRDSSHTCKNTKTGRRVVGGGACESKYGPEYTQNRSGAFFQCKNTKTGKIISI